MDSGSDEGSDEEYTNGHQNLTNGHLENGVSDGSEVSEEEEDNNDSESEKEEVYGKQEVDNGDSGSEQGSEDQNDREGSNRDSESEGEENGQNDQELEEDEVSSMSDEPAEEETKQVGLKASEESYGRGEARESDNESDNGEEMEDEEQEDGEDEEDDAEDEDEEQDDAEDDEQESPTKSTGSDEEDSSPISKKGRGRPKKHQAAYSDEETASTNNRNNKQIMKDEEIARSLNDSSERSRSRKASRKIALDEEDEDDEPLGKRKAKYDDDDDDFEDDGEDEEEDEEIESDDDDSDEQPKKRRKIEEDDNRRRSGRERKAPKKFEVEVDKTKKRKKKRKHESSSANDESDSDYDIKKRKGRKKKTKKKAKPKTKAPERAKRKRTKVQSSDENSEASADDISEDEGTVKRYKAKMKREKSKLKISRQDYEDKQSERHKGKQRVKYADDDTSHDSDIDSTYDVHDAEVEDEDVEQIGFVLDYRIGKKGATGESTMHFTVQEHGDPNLTLETEETEDQYLIKWDGWAHFNNTWESNQSLENRPNNKPVKGIRKLQNYVNKVRDYTRWKKMATPEDVEYQEVEVELGRNLLKTYLEPERIFAEKINLETGGTDYYVKWKNLPYSESTWEDPSIVKSYYPTYFEEYLARKKSKSNPKNYKETIKLIKKTWKPMKEQPDYIGSETLRLRDYQMDGINFLLDAWHKGNSMILADEMGLGKTIQTISFLKYLFHNYKFKGPMLVSVPLSTLAAWQKEFETWAPEMNVIAYIGDGKSREIIRQYECEDQESGELIFNVLLTNYEMVGKDRDFFVDIAWSNIVIDEAHRLKNHDSLLYKVLMDIESHHRLLLTGTPLQNSLKELWCLLNYIQIPDLDPWEVFEINYGSKKDQELGYVKLHTLLKPFIIRRLKKDVEKSLPGKVERILRVDMTVAQKRMYKNVLTRNFDVLSKGKNQISLLNLMMQLRKTCNHSHLLMEPEEIPQNDADRCKQLVYGSGKLVLLDKLLARFREKGDRVLIFSQMVTMLNIIEEYLLLRRYQFQRLDGSVSADKRKQSIARFNNPDSTDFCFLLSTKAGGLGINLQTANRVIIFDSDFNPQNDLQAIARAHRIGQKEEVKIYRLVSSNSVDEDIIQRAKNKMVLDHLVIQRMDTTGQSIIGGDSSGSRNIDGNQLSKEDLNMILKFGAAELFKAEETEKEGEIDLDAILEQAEVREEVGDDAHQSDANKELLGAFKCTTLSFEETEKEIEVEYDSKGLDWDAIIPLEFRPEKQNETYNEEAEVLKRKLRKKGLRNESHKDTQMKGSYGDSEEEYMVNSEDESSEDGSGSENSMKKQGSEKKYKCNKCVNAYTTENRLRLHILAKHKELKYGLTEENYTKLPKNGMDDLSNISSKENRITCLICFNTFRDNQALKGHISRKHLAIFRKKHEGVGCQDPNNLKEIRDPSTEASDIPAEIKLLVNCDNTNNNVKSDSGPSSQSKLTKEMALIGKMFNSMKKYACSQCDQRFSKKGEMVKHEKEHTYSTWKYTCSHCEQKFPYHTKLIKHEKRGCVNSCKKSDFLSDCISAQTHEPLHEKLASAVKTVNVVPASVDEISPKIPKKENSSFTMFETEDESNDTVVTNATKEKPTGKVDAVIRKTPVTTVIRKTPVITVMQKTESNDPVVLNIGKEKQGAKPNDPFADVGPNTDIVVTSNNEKGYDVYKVIKIYSTGARFKCVKYSHLNQDRWTLTQEVNKNVMKANIKKIVDLKKDQVGENVYTIGMGELVPIEKKASLDYGDKEVSYDDRENYGMSNGNSSQEVSIPFAEF